MANHCCDVSGTEPLRPGGGETLATLQALAGQGLLMRVAGDVFLPADMVNRRPLRVAALARLVPQHAVVTGSAAAWVWGGPLMPVVRVLLPRDSSHRLPACVAASQDTRLVDEHLQRFPVDGERDLVVTNPARSALEIMGHEDPDESEASLRWLREHLVTRDEVVELMQVRHRYPGARAWRDRVTAALARWDSSARSA